MNMAGACHMNKWTLLWILLHCDWLDCLLFEHKGSMSAQLLHQAWCKIKPPSMNWYVPAHELWFHFLQSAAEKVRRTNSPTNGGLFFVCSGNFKASSWMLNSILGWYFIFRIPQYILYLLLWWDSAGGFVRNDSADIINTNIVAFYWKIQSKKKLTESAPSEEWRGKR